MRAADTPAPGQGQPVGGFSTLATNGGKVSATSGKSALEWEEYRARQVPGPESTVGTSSVAAASFSHNAHHAGEVAERTAQQAASRRKLKAAVRVVCATSKMNAVMKALMKSGMASRSGLVAAATASHDPKPLKTAQVAAPAPAAAPAVMTGKAAAASLSTAAGAPPKRLPKKSKLRGSVRKKGAAKAKKGGSKK